MDKSISLFNLTIDEFIALNKMIISEELERLTLNRKVEPVNFDFIFIKDVELLTGYKKSTIYSKVSKFEMPCISRKKPLMFSRSELERWIQNGKPFVSNPIEEKMKNNYHSKNRK